MLEILNKLVWRYVTSIGIVLCGKDSPDPPDYTGAAQATAAGNQDAARVAAMANRIDQYTPYGNLIYRQNDPSNQDHWSSYQVLSPEQQSMLDKNNNLANGLLDTAGNGLGAVNSAMFAGLNEGKLAQPSIQGQSVQDAIMSRLEPTFARNEDQLRTRLTNQGIMGGSEAFNNELQTFNQGKNDAYVNAALQGINTGNQARAQGIQEQYAGQDRPLNIINALRTGNQVTLPQFSTPGAQQNVGGPDLLGAAQSNYNAQLGASNAKNAAFGNTMGGLFGLAGVGLQPGGFLR